MTQNKCPDEDIIAANNRILLAFRELESKYGILHNKADKLYEALQGLQNWAYHIDGYTTADPQIHLAVEALAEYTGETHD